MNNTTPNASTLVNQILQQFGANTSTGVDPNNPISALAPIDLSNFNIQNVGSYFSNAFNQLKPYYSKLLTEAGGDVNRAINNLETDYKTGVRYAQEDYSASTQSEQSTEEKENKALIDALNKRGIALTQTPDGKLTYAGAGEPQTEYQSLSEDQQLRQQAIDRTKARTIESAGTTLSRGTEQSVRGYQQTGEQYQNQLEGQVYSLGAQQEAQNAQVPGALAQASSFNAATNTGTGGSSVNPNDANSIKAAFKGYAGWSDPNAIIADYKATQGSGKA